MVSSEALLCEECGTIFRTVKAPDEYRKTELDEKNYAMLVLRASRSERDGCTLTSLSILSEYYP
jgi:hypothetical protein